MARPRSSRHAAATFRAVPTCFDAIVHIAQACAIIGAFETYIGAHPAYLLVVLRADHHHVRGRLTHFGAGQHEPEMMRLHVFAAELEASLHRCIEALTVAYKTVVDAVIHLGSPVLVHGCALVVLKSCHAENVSAHLSRTRRMPEGSGVTHLSHLRRLFRRLGRSFGLRGEGARDGHAQPCSFGLAASRNLRKCASSARSPATVLARRLRLGIVNFPSLFERASTAG